MGRASADTALTVRVAYSPRAGEVDEVGVAVAAGTTLLEALRASGILERHPEIDLSVQAFGIWGRPRPHDAALREGDRVEVWRPLQIDPKEARRLRQRRQQAATGNPRR